MKKLFCTISFLCLLLINSYAQGKLFNSPNNYRYSFPNKQDTIYIDYGKGKMFELNCAWYEVYKPVKESKHYRNLLTELNQKFNIVQKKIKEISFKDDTKYHIILDQKIVHDDSYKNEIISAWKERKSLKKQGFSKVKIDSIFSIKKITAKQKMIEKYGKDYCNNLIFGFYQPRQTVLKVIERKIIPEEREFILKNGQLFNQVHWQHIIEIRGLNWKAKFYITDLNDINNFDINFIRKSIKKDAENYFKKQYYRYYTRNFYVKENKEIKHLKTLYRRSDKRPKFHKPFIDLSVGSSLTKGELSVDASCSIGLCFNNNLPGAAKLGLRSQLKSFGIDHRIQNNLFTDAFLSAKVNWFSNEYQWVSAGFGYLVKRDGNIYGKNTGRAFLKYTINDRWGIQPEINYSFHDNKAMLSLGFSFKL